MIHRWAPRVLAVCCARIRHRDSAEELAQESLARGLRSLPSLSDPDRFGAWLCGIATRTCLDWLKARARTEVQLSTEYGLSHGTTPADQVASQDELSALMEAVDQLPDSLREALLIYYYCDVTYEDLGTMLGVSSATVNARLTKARSVLREKLLCRGGAS